jgi:hypothetical protein
MSRTRHSTVGSPPPPSSARLAQRQAVVRRTPATRGPRRAASPLALPLVVALLAAVGIAVYLGLIAPLGPRAVFTATFPASWLITNEYAYEHPLDPRAVQSSQWETTSGSLFARDGGAWTGVPDGSAPDARSSSATDSAVFRLRTRRSDFANVAVSFSLRLQRLLTTPRTPARAYDGVHVWLRYQSHEWLYFASFSRRDGAIVIGKKLSTVGGGRYYDLVRVPGHPFPLAQWEPVRVTIGSDRHRVLIRVFIAGRRVAAAVDDGTRGPAILRPGRVGVRGDNAEFEFRSFRVTAT